MENQVHCKLLSDNHMNTVFKDSDWFSEKKNLGIVQSKHKNAQSIIIALSWIMSLERNTVYD